MGIIKKFNYSYFNKTKDKIKYVEERTKTHKINWKCISKNQNLCEDFIEKFQDKLNWLDISKYQKLSESFIERFQDNVDWRCISIFQKISEPFIEKFQDNVDWFSIKINQNLSEGFIEKFQDRVDWLCITSYQFLSNEFIKKYKNKLGSFDNLSSQFYCGRNNRVIFITNDNPDIIQIGCSKYNKEEAIKKIKEEYDNDKEMMDDYINKVELCFKEANERKK